MKTSVIDAQPDKNKHEYLTELTALPVAGFFKYISRPVYVFHLILKL